MNKIVIIIVLLSCSSLAAWAQDYRIEVRARAAWHYTLTSYQDTDIGSDYITFAQADAYYFFLRRIGAGVTYGRSIGDFGYTNSPFLMNKDASPHYQHYGLRAMLTTDRTRRVSVYLTASALKAEQVIDFGGFKSASSGTGFGAGFGMNIKLGRAFSFNLMDVYGIKYSDSFGFGDKKPSVGIGASSGFVFKFLRER